MDPKAKNYKAYYVKDNPKAVPEIAGEPAEPVEFSPGGVVQPATVAMRRLAAIGLAVAIVAAAVAQDRPLVFQVGAELVVLDMVAIDASGRDVGDLSASEIQVVEDGSPRPVQQLQLIKRRVTLTDGAPPANPAPAAARHRRRRSRIPDSASLSSPSTSTAFRWMPSRGSTPPSSTCSPRGGLTCLPR